VRVFNWTTMKVWNSNKIIVLIWDYLLIWHPNIVLQFPYYIICFNEFFSHGLYCAFAPRNNTILLFNDTGQTNLFNLNDKKVRCISLYLIMRDPIPFVLVLRSKDPAV
jgi:uncharacterized membrane protein